MVDDGERNFLLVGKGLSDEEMADTVMAWLGEHGVAEDDDDPPTPSPTPSPPEPRPGIAVAHERASETLAKIAGAQKAR